MPTENTSLKNVTPAGDSNTTDEMVIGKINTYQRTFLIVAGSLLTLLVWIAITGTSGGQYLTSSAAEITKGGAGALAEYHVDTANSALNKDSSSCCTWIFCLCNIDICSTVDCSF